MPGVGHKHWIGAFGILALALVAALVTLCSRQAAGQIQAPPGDPTAGRVLAERLCTTCHDIGGVSADRGKVTTEVPSFASIAARPGQTTANIAGRIVVPHPEMPQIQLTRNEIAALSAYIFSLRPQQGGSR